MHTRAGVNAQRIAVLREAFASSFEDPRPLSSLIASLGNNSVAVASDAASYQRRLLVDEYQQSGNGKYALKNVATDLYR